MKARVYHYSTPSKKSADYECEDMVIDVDIPFVPTKGTGLKLTPAGDFLIVDQIMWSFEQPDVIQIFTEEPDQLPIYKNMVREGWKKS